MMAWGAAVVFFALGVVAALVAMGIVLIIAYGLFGFSSREGEGVACSGFPSSRPTMPPKNRAIGE